MERKKPICYMTDYPNIKNLFLVGFTRKAIAEKLNLEYHTVCKVIRDYGLSSPKKVKPKRNLDFYSNDYTG